MPKIDQITRRCHIGRRVVQSVPNGCSPIEDDGDKVSFFLSENGVVYYRRDREKARNIVSVLRNFSTTEKMRSELEAMGIPFQYPKPKELLQYILQVGCEKDGIVLDFFAGSGSTAHAAWLQEVVDKVKRRLILVQLPEPLDATNEKQRAAIQFCDNLKRPRSIAEVTKERLRRVGKKIHLDTPLLAGDTGFRVFKLDKSNIRAWSPDPAQIEQTLLDHHEHLLQDRSEADLLYELVLKLGLDLCVSVESRKVGGKEIHSVGGGVLFICMASEILNTDVEMLATSILTFRKELAPAGDTTCVFRDSAFADDVAKTNMAAILEQNGIQTVRSL